MAGVPSRPLLSSRQESLTTELAALRARGHEPDPDARAQPPGALELELVAGAWDKTNLTQTGRTPWVGEAVSRAVTLGGAWARLEFTVPPATYSSAASPLVGLQLRLRAVAGPGHVYLDDVSVFERAR